MSGPDCAVLFPVTRRDCVPRSEMAEVVAYEQRGDRSFQLVFLLSGMLAFFINMSQIWCTKVKTLAALQLSWTQHAHSI